MQRIRQLIHTVFQLLQAILRPAPAARPDHRSAATNRQQRRSPVTASDAPHRREGEAPAGPHPAGPFPRESLNSTGTYQTAPPRPPPEQRPSHPPRHASDGNKATQKPRPHKARFPPREKGNPYDACAACAPLAPVAQRFFNGEPLSDAAPVQHNAPIVSLEKDCHEVAAHIHCDHRPVRSADRRPGQTAQPADHHRRRHERRFVRLHGQPAQDDAQSRRLLRHGPPVP